MNEEMKKQVLGLIKDSLTIEVKKHCGCYGESRFLEISLLVDGDAFNTLYIDLPDTN